MQRKINMSNVEFEDKIVSYVFKSIKAKIRSISIIGSYTIDRKVRLGSDIDTVIVIENLNNITVNFDNIFYKFTTIDDSEGRRIELNTKLENTVLDITIIDEFSHPNNPLTDWYENHLGWCENAICIFGTPFSELFDLKERKKEYAKLRKKRLGLVEEKIEMTERKIIDQKRRDLHIMYELQTYIFIREIINRRLFNRLSIKHPNDAILDFDNIYKSELSKCGVILQIIDL